MYNTHVCLSSVFPMMSSWFGPHRLAVLYRGIQPFQVSSRKFSSLYIPRILCIFLSCLVSLCYRYAVIKLIGYTHYVLYIFFCIEKIIFLGYGNVITTCPYHIHIYIKYYRITSFATSSRPLNSHIEFTLPGIGLAKHVLVPSNLNTSMPLKGRKIILISSMAKVKLKLACIAQKTE